MSGTKTQTPTTSVLIPTFTEAHIDSDSLVYAAGFSTEGEPVENCFHLLNRSIQKIKDAVPADKHYLYITGPGNYRDAVPEYKANRTARRPEHYHAAREFLMEQHDAELVTGMEADDAVAIEQKGDETCIVSIDKDLLQVPGWHYSWKKGYRYVTEFQGHQWFYQQLLEGDTADNIKGLLYCTEEVRETFELSAHSRRGCGTNSAIRILSDCSTLGELHDTVSFCYESLQKETGENHMHTYAHLLWMTRELDEHNDPVPWSPPND